METIHIKRAETDKDISTAAGLAYEIWHQHFTPIIGKAQVEYMIDKFQSYPAMKKAIENGYIYYLAFSGDEPCGYCAVKNDNGLFLSKFYVKERFRGIGIGKALLDKIYSFASDQGLGRIWLTCNKYNSRTLEIYDRLGYSIIDSVVTDIGNGFVMDDYILEKIL